MKYFTFILILVLFICVPATVFAAIYQDKFNNFEMKIPDGWVTDKRNTFYGNILIINYPLIEQTSIFMKVSDKIANQDTRETLENYTQQDIAALIESMKTEIANMLPEVKFEDVKTRYFAKNLTIQLNYTDGNKEYCVTEFLLQGNIYMLVFTVPTKEYTNLSPAFFNMLNSIKTICAPKNGLSPKNIPTV